MAAPLSSRGLPRQTGSGPDPRWDEVTSHPRRAGGWWPSAGQRGVATPRARGEGVDHLVHRAGGQRGAEVEPLRRRGAPLEEDARLLGGLDAADHALEAEP